MGVKALFAPQIGGGVPFCRLSLYINRHLLTPALSGVLSHSIEADFQPERGKTYPKQVKSKDIFDCFCLTLVILETEIVKILRYF